MRFFRTRSKTTQDDANATDPTAAPVSSPPPKASSRSPAASPRPVRARGAQTHAELEVYAADLLADEDVDTFFTTHGYEERALEKRDGGHALSTPRNTRNPSEPIDTEDRAAAQYLDGAGNGGEGSIDPCKDPLVTRDRPAASGHSRQQPSSGPSSNGPDSAMSTRVIVRSGLNRPVQRPQSLRTDVSPQPVVSRPEAARAEEWPASSASSRQGGIARPATESRGAINLRIWEIEDLHTETPDPADDDVAIEREETGHRRSPGRYAPNQQSEAHAAPIVAERSDLPEARLDDVGLQTRSEQEPRTPAHPFFEPEAEQLEGEPDIQTKAEAAADLAHGSRPLRAAGRVKTRLLGFQAEERAVKGVFDQSEPSATSPTVAMFPVGWLVVIEGPGRGAFFSLFNGVSHLGRGEGQTVRLDFGDTTISRHNHAAIAFDDELGSFFLGHGGKSNLVRLNGKPVLSTEPLNDGDIVRLGQTTLRFVALCGERFSWVCERGGAHGSVATE